MCYKDKLKFGGLLKGSYSFSSTIVEVSGLEKLKTCNIYPNIENNNTNLYKIFHNTYRVVAQYHASYYLILLQCIEF